MSCNRNQRRNPREATGLDEEQPSRSRVTSDFAAPVASPSGSSSRRAGAVSQPSPPEAHCEDRHESAPRNRRNRGAYAGQEPSDSNGTAGKAADRGSTAARGSGSGSGSGSSSSGRSGSSGMSLTEENVRRTSTYFEVMRRENAGERGESSGRRASLLATLEEAGSKLSGGRR